MAIKEIKLRIELSEDRVPEKITWEADESSEGDGSEASAFLLTLFEKKSRETLRIDLWTLDFQVQEMDRLIYHTLQGMASTYEKATTNRAMAEEIKEFALKFASKTGILKDHSDSSGGK